MSEQNLIDPCALFIGNIPYTFTENELQKLVANYGNVVAAAIVCDERQRSRGFAFVRFVETAGAEAATEALNGSELEGRSIRVTPTRTDSRYLSLIAG